MLNKRVNIALKFVLIIKKLLDCHAHVSLSKFKSTYIT